MEEPLPIDSFSHDHGGDISSLLSLGHCSLGLDLLGLVDEPIPATHPQSAQPHQPTKQSRSVKTQQKISGPKVENGLPGLTKPTKPPRKRPNRYANASPSVIERRRHQNRDSQRAYRKRKDDEITQLRDEVERLQKIEKELRNSLRDLQQLLPSQRQQTQLADWGIFHPSFQHTIPQSQLSLGELTPPIQSQLSLGELTPPIQSQDSGWDGFTARPVNSDVLSLPQHGLAPSQRIPTPPTDVSYLGDGFTIFASRNNPDFMITPHIDESWKIQLD
ncbi:hypothetical protein F5B22DRAFT_643420 [Xylaria bambusicola]|uniref:uncharacterized protein n=1 Tax=Xylaria bambusicola TaxID=326684 RepID=UPI00200804EA|nr:uncharacterized protein F5B22DRAFT_643420 [Xylaria bambusicola]KAI0521834.1 hypothetical protein F5B22DRAFT_643420 [Xylaria bambusicola]